MVMHYQGQEEYKYDLDWRKGVQQQASVPSFHPDLQLKMPREHLKLTCGSAMLSDWQTLEPRLLTSHLDFYVMLLLVVVTPSFYGGASVNVYVCQAWGWGASCGLLSSLHGGLHKEGTQNLPEATRLHFPSSPTISGRDSYRESLAWSWTTYQLPPAAQPEARA